jgi:hypothetical protein
MTDETTFQSGALIDTRTDAEKALDLRFEEIVPTADVVNWVEKPQDQWRHFPIFNQDGSGSCVAQTQAKEFGIMRQLKDGHYVHFSASDIYQRRMNKPSVGMQGADVRNIAAQGVTLEALAPSQNMTDAQMDAEVIEPYKREVGSVFSVTGALTVTAGDIETVASIIQRTQKGVMCWFYFQYNEWTARPQVINASLDLYAASTCRHSVCAVDFTLVNGKKALIIDDSWGTSYGFAGERVIDEDFFKARNWFASYLMNFKFDDQTQPKPTPAPHVFNTDLYVGVSDATDVSALQDILKYEGMFPTNTQSSGQFGPLTLTGVKQFQTKYAIAGPADAGYGRVGPHTRAKLNALYGA